MTRILAWYTALFFFASSVWAADDSIISKKSPYTVKKTLNRLEKILRSKGVVIARRWSHDKVGKKVGVPIRSTELLIFSDPKLEAHFFTSNQLAGLDLPMKALAWRDESGQVWLAYTDPQFIADRHAIRDRDGIIKKLAEAMKEMTDAAIDKN